MDMRRAVLALVILAVGCGSKEAPPTAAPTLAAAPSPGSATASATPGAPGALDAAAAAAQLAAIGARAQAALAAADPAPPPDDENAPRVILALGPCTRPTADEKAALVKRLDAWTAHAIARAKPTGALDDVAFGCMDHGAIIVDTSRDVRVGGSDQGHAWTLRVTPTAITIVDHMQGDARATWMEWAAENTVATLALVDLDGDGVLDPVWAEQEHEGGASASEYTIKTGAPPGVTVASVHGDIYIPTKQPAPDERALVLELETHGVEVHRFVCVTAAPRAGACPAAAAATHAAAQLAAATRLVEDTGAVLADRGLLDELLALLEVPIAERAPLLAYAAAHGSAFDAVIAKFVRARHAAHDARAGDEQVTLEQRAAADLTGVIRTALHEPACPAPTAAQLAAAHAAVTRWIRAHDPTPTALTFFDGCLGTTAGYVGASWTRGATADAGDAQRGALFYLKGGAVNPILQATAEIDGPNPSPVGIDAKFHTTGASLVALAVEPGIDGAPGTLTAIVDGKVTGTRPLGGNDELAWTGQAIDASFAMTHDTLARTQDAGQVTFWHATAAGVVAAATIPVAPLAAPPAATDALGQALEADERRRNADDLLETPPAGPRSPDDRAAALAAIRVLGAPQAILDEAAAAR
jgi:hypothetical protein